MKKQRWQIPDLIDLEFFLDRDDGEELDALTARDRAIFKQLFSGHSGEATHPSLLLAGWLAARRREAAEQNEPLPGRSWQEFFLLFCWGCLLTGLVAGGGAAFSFLSYTGTRPVNVSAYFGLFVVLQLALLLLFMLISMYRAAMGKGLERSLLYRLLQRLFFKVMAQVSRRASSSLSTDARVSWSARIAPLSALQQRYGSLFSRPFFLLGQLCGVSFNAGVLMATLLKVIGSDVAFGWQSSLQVDSETVYGLVRWISAPWSWLMTTVGCPSPAQIEGTRLILKDGIYHLATRDLVSWWPFLCLSVLFYALLPRSALLVGGIIRQRKELAALQFGHGPYRQVIHRMQTPLLSARAPVEDLPGPEETGFDQKNSMQEDGHSPGRTPAPIVALVPDELFDEQLLQPLAELVRGRLGYELGSLLPFWSLEHGEDEELSALQVQMAERGAEDVFLLFEAWQPPIRELFSFLDRLRTAIGKEATIIIGLIGKPTPKTMMTRVKEQNLQIWRQHLAAHGDAGVLVVELVK